MDDFQHLRKSLEDCIFFKIESWCWSLAMLQRVYIWRLLVNPRHCQSRAGVHCCPTETLGNCLSASSAHLPSPLDYGHCSCCRMMSTRKLILTQHTATAFVQVF
ncbi:uncharacterized protein LOC124348639 [Daphnia pulicaria]|uniref:uncharacterized protein LOC124348639 n=1 Tax=Daphnia pulicaria TaxID=35523 RepID=UPI001EE9C485|nr:uncharacterized protein LOC124348639 [Daphnia pulicaria]